MYPKSEELIMEEFRKSGEMIRNSVSWVLEHAQYSVFAESDAADVFEAFPTEKWWHFE